MSQMEYPAELVVEPVEGPVDAVARVPGSKSITNRALLIAALAAGQSTLRGALASDDTRYMSGALQTLGIAIERDEAAAEVVVQGGDGRFSAPEADCFVGNSGTTMRFLTAALPLGPTGARYRIDGVSRMRQRPIAPLLQAMRDLGATVEDELGTGCPPVRVTAGGWRGGATAMDGGESSQFFSALLMTAPYAEQGATVEILGDLVSKPYMTMTAAVMRDFGVEVELDNEGWRTFRVAPGQRYRGRAYRVEPDASNASYFLAAAAVTGGRIRVDGLGKNSAQGDLRFVDALAAMGCEAVVADDYTEVRGPDGGALCGVELDMNAISDTAQTLAAIAPFADGPTTIRGIAHARLKETDRVAALATELRKLGQGVREHPDGLTITPASVQPAAIDTYDDHRMAMSFTVTGLRAPGVVIRDPGCVAKTFPTFYRVLDEVVGASRVASGAGDGGNG